MKSIRNILLPFLLLTLFVAYQASISMFSHVHYVNGVMIVHSHPSDDSQHAHTETQVITIAQIASFIGLEPVVSSIGQAFFPVLDNLEFDRSLSFVSALHTLHTSLRAPPFACL